MNLITHEAWWEHIDATKVIIFAFGDARNHEQRHNHQLLVACRIFYTFANSSHLFHNLVLI